MSPTLPRTVDDSARVARAQRSAPMLRVGAAYEGASGALVPYVMPAHHLTTHAVVVGMTGSGKTGLVTVLVEEALAAGVPVLAIDVKGDLPNLLLAFPTTDAEPFVPWAAASAEPSDDRDPHVLAEELASKRREALARWSIGEPELRAFHDRVAVRVLTPGSSAGERLHVLSALERRSDRWTTDPDAARAALSAALSLVLRLVGREADPAKSREHVLLSVLAERRSIAGDAASLEALLQDLEKPPIERVGALRVDAFFPKKERRALAAALNTLLASPTFASWREGASLGVEAWMDPRGGEGGRTPATIVSVAHLDDEERALVLGVLLEEVLTWVRGLPGSQRLRGLVVFDEVYGFLPPHPANPPTKRPIVAMMKQARAFGVGVVVATQNPMDLDYRALSNAGVWCVGRLQTDADRARVVEGMAGADSNGAGLGADSAELGDVVRQLAQRWFVVRDARGGGGRGGSGGGGVALVQPRWAMSWLRGPMTRGELRRALETRGDEPPQD